MEHFSPESLKSNMKTRTLPLFLLAGMILGLAGCATRYEVRLDALNSGEIGPRGNGLSYRLASATPGIEESDLFFKEVARHLEPVLIRKGYEPAGEEGNPDLLIKVDAHLSEPLVETRSYSEPVYLERHGYMRTFRVPVLNDEGKVVRYHYSRYYVPPRTTFSGWIDRDQQVTVYDKVLSLSARRILEDGSLTEEVWAITISMRDQSTDYRSSLPYMLVAAAPYIGARTEGEQVIVLKGDDEELESYRARMARGG